ncbi:MAG: CTP-dependent riboflavin kinase [Deltaproteobacteria bacterium]|nr:CTP-dependent riboflavin kinase [Deltaproteobacteria bacterium]
MIIDGELFTGAGQGAYFTQLEGYRRQFETKLGFTPFPGTVNLRVRTQEGLGALQRLRTLPGIPIDPWGGSTCGARCFRVRIGDRLLGGLVIPDETFYSEDVLELMAPENVRQALGLADGDTVRVEILLEHG